MRYKLPIFIVATVLSFPLYFMMGAHCKDLPFLGLSFLVGIYLLVDGSDYFVEGAASIANHLKVSEHTIGLTIVALATSLPEMAVSDIASFYGHPETAWGNAVGSNIANIGLVLGVAAILMPLSLSKYIKRDSITLALVTLLLLLFLVLFNAIFWWMGLVFLIIYLIYLNDIRGRSEDIEEIEPEKSMVISVILTIFGALGIVWGANVLVDSAINISLVLGIPEVVIATTAIAVGTSLPELATTISATIKKRHGIAVGNVIGSNVFNTLVVLGSASVIHSIPLHSEDLFVTTLFLVVLTFLLVIFSLRQRLGKMEGISFILLYGLFLCALLLL